MKNLLTYGTITLIVGFASATLGGYGSMAKAANDESRGREQATQQDELVDCELPGQVKPMGGDMNYMTPKRRVKTTAKECKNRGGKVSTGTN